MGQNTLIKPLEIWLFLATPKKKYFDHFIWSKFAINLLSEFVNTKNMDSKKDVKVV